MRPAEMIDKIGDFRGELNKLSAYLEEGFNRLWDKYRTDEDAWYLFKAYVESKAYMKHLDDSLFLLQEELSLYEE